MHEIYLTKRNGIDCWVYADHNGPIYYRDNFEEAFALLENSFKGRNVTKITVEYQ